MISSLLSLVHLIGLAWALGSATVKFVLLLRCRVQPGFVPVYLQVVRQITRQIVIGLILLTLSGIGWLLYGYPFTPLLIAKLFLVGAIWVLGPIIDNVAEPRFRKLAPAGGGQPSGEFMRAQWRYLALEFTATGLFYVVVGIWLLL